MYLHLLRRPVMKSMSLEEGMLGALAFTESLKNAMGNCLVMTALYGSIARGGFNRETSDVNILVVLRKMGTAIYKTLSSPIQNAREDFKLSPLFLEEKELSRFADLFPVRFYEIKKCYRILHGGDVLKDIAMDWSLFRERVRYDLFDVRQELKRGLLYGLPSTFMLSRTLKALAPRLLSITRVLGESPGGEKLTIDPFYSHLHEKRQRIDGLPDGEVEELYFSIIAYIDSLLESLERK
jgi:predicted nucleotidyltransferase